MESLPNISNFSVRNLIGKGGMANIYSAYNTENNTPVAIKVLHESLSKKNPKLVDLFVKEANLMLSLSHPNLIQAYAINKMDNGLPFITMELIKGLTLKEILQNKNSISAKNALYIVAKIASALAYLHDLGISHRDIKPSNIMIEKKTKRILLTDFGIASESLDALDYSAGNKVAGTALYMSPEQVKDDHITGKTDIYSLGVCLYMLLTGHAPFMAKEKADIRKMHINTVFPHLPEKFAYLNEMLQTMCCKRAEERYSAVSLLEKLHQIDKTPKSLDNATIPLNKQQEKPPLKKKQLFKQFFLLFKGQ